MTTLQAKRLAKPQRIRSWRSSDAKTPSGGGIASLIRGGVGRILRLERARRGRAGYDVSRHLAALRARKADRKA